MNIELINKNSKRLEKGIEYFWKQRGSESNWQYYSKGYTAFGESSKIYSKKLN